MSFTKWIKQIVIDVIRTKDTEEPTYTDVAKMRNCDVIDTTATGLDTNVNVNDLRHSAYSVNSILLRDIEDIVVTGKRASDRSTIKRFVMYSYWATCLLLSIAYQLEKSRRMSAFGINNPLCLHEFCLGNLPA